MNYIKKIIFLLKIWKYKAVISFLLLILLSLFILSCTYFQVSSKRFSKKNLIFSPRDSFYLESIKIVSFNFLEDKQVEYIMNRKLEFELVTVENIQLVRNENVSRYVIKPELIIKSYQQAYRDRNYYLLIIGIYRKKELVFQYNYEYSGSRSIFDATVQNTLLKRFLRDFNISG